MRPAPGLLRVGVVVLAALVAPRAVVAQGGGQERAVVDQFDVNRNGRLDPDERVAAREFLARSNQGFRRGFARGGFRAPAESGVPISRDEVTLFPDAPLFDEGTLRTFFVEFDNPDWEAELVDFNNTDVDVPATVTVDGRTYRDVGIHFRGNSSFNVGNGYKRSLNLKFDFVHRNQDVGGYQTLNFLNANGDPTFLRSVLSLHIARQYIPAPKANFVRVVINGENWGVYASAQQFDRDFLRDNFGTTRGTRWKVPQGGFGGGLGGFAYIGDNPDSYKGTFQIKTRDDPEAWATVVSLARVLEQTPPERLEAALAPLVDVDRLLRFLALDVAMAGGDGFYQRASDYSLYRHPDGRLQLTFHDANEMFNFGGGRGGPGGGGVFLHPLISAGDPGKPIISKVLAVPALRARYARYVREIAETSFDWAVIGPLIQQYRALIADDVTRDTRKLFSTEEFDRGTTDAPATGSLRDFFERRRAFLLSWAAEFEASSAAPTP